MDTDHEDSASRAPRAAWNKGKLIGQKPPLRPKHVWSIRTKLQMRGRVRDLAIFNLAIDSKLRGCDVIALRVEDVAPSGYAVDRATVREKKTGQPVRLELTEQTRQAIDDYLLASGKKAGEFLFPGRRRSGNAMTTRQYARLVASWIESIGLDPHFFRNALTASDEGNADLPPHRQPSCRPAATRASEDREHRPLPRHRGRRRTCDRRASRRLNWRGKADRLCPTLTVRVVPKADLGGASPSGYPGNVLPHSTAQRR
jgi:hypothetical protein